MNEFFINAYVVTNVGLKRANNEDNFLLMGETVNSQNSFFYKASLKNQFIAAVCDGMGGTKNGELASQMVVSLLNDNKNHLFESSFSKSTIEKVVRNINLCVCNKMTSNGVSMGTTLSFIGVADGMINAVNVGDSRIYKFSNGNLCQISYDHTQVQLMREMGINDKTVLDNKAHILTQHIGIFESEMLIEPYIYREQCAEGNKYLICSDGLTDMVSDNDIETVLSKYSNIDFAAEKLIEKALQNGGKDNVTVLVVEIV